ncbi:MAG TPA: YkgJ family cysteine cluster protein, partial [Hyphomicrobiaceae bacterium]|nr:YkgJ family cysteine cluster protein [Hyphomicrobiaceae bacterium]
VISLTKPDVQRLAKHHGITFDKAEARFTRSGHGYKRIMKRKKDKHFGRICRFFDTDARRCTVYKARPGVCRTFPASKRCGYYDFLTFERHHQKDPEFVATTDSAEWK